MSLGPIQLFLCICPGCNTTIRTYGATDVIICPHCSLGFEWRKTSRQSNAHPDSTASLLNERQKSHGSFVSVAMIAQELKLVLRQSTGWSTLPATQREALEMDCTKTARIIAGDHNFEDHWRDKAGYATLIADAVPK